MERTIAFLRAINVGGHNVKMETLRALFEGLDFSNVSTFIASGNVVFESRYTDSQTLEREIQQRLRESLGYDVAVFVRTISELAAIVSCRPFRTADVDGPGSSLYVAFLHAPLLDAVRQSILMLRGPTDDFYLHEREIYWLCRTKLSESPVFIRGLLDKAIRVPTTVRNITTLRKIAAKYGSPGPP